LTFPWTSYQANDVLPGSVRSTSLSKSTLRQGRCVSLLMGRDIFGCQKKKKVGSGVFLRIDSYNLHDNRFFVGNELSLCFSLDRLLFLSRIVAVSSRCQIVLGLRNFIRNCLSEQLPAICLGKNTRGQCLNRYKTSIEIVFP
jgi:hypothetical protein